MRIKNAWKPVLTRKIVPKDHTMAPFMIGLGHDDGSIIILDAAASPSGGDVPPVYHFYRLSADGSLSAPLEPNDAAHDRPLFDPRTNRFAGFAQNGETETYGLDDPALQALYDRAAQAAPGENVRVVSTAADPRKMVIYAEGRQDPGAYYLLDFVAGTTVNLGEDYQDLPTEWIAEQKPITYKARDGLEIHALLTLPPKAPAQASNLPLVVLPHDGLQAHDRQGFDWLAQALASRGYVVLQPNYRGSDGYGPAFIAAGYGQGGRKMQSDLSDGVASLVAEGLVDPKRVCVLGVGLGGYAALTAAATGDPTYRCAGAINGVADPTAYAATLKGRLPRPEQDLITTLAPDPHWPRAFITNPGSPRVFSAYFGADAPSPVKLAGQVRAPLLLLEVADDPVVPASQSRAMRDALTAAGKPVDLVELKGAEHAPASEATRLATLKAVLDFLGQADPAG
jgi:dipeptidyl aminopeptidase/acylaminoacyl peptidase